MRQRDGVVLVRACFCCLEDLFGPSAVCCGQVKGITLSAFGRALPAVEDRLGVVLDGLAEGLGSRAGGPSGGSVILSSWCSLMGLPTMSDVSRVQNSFWSRISMWAVPSGTRVGRTRGVGVKSLRGGSCEFEGVLPVEYGPQLHTPMSLMIPDEPVGPTPIGRGMSGCSCAADSGGGH